MRHLLCVFVLIGVSVCIGCGRKSSGLEGVAKVAGTVTYQGKPVEGASVVFSPDGQGRPASGKTDASGRFQLTTLEANDGALPGKYQVAISKVEVESSGVDPTKADEMAKQFLKRQGGAAAKGEALKGGDIKNLLPEKYKDAKASGLTAEVTKGGKNDFPFTLD